MDIMAQWHGVHLIEEGPVETVASTEIQLWGQRTPQGPWEEESTRDLRSDI